MTNLSKEGGEDEESGKGHHDPHVKDGGPEEESEVADDHEDEGRDVDCEDGVAVEPRHGHPHSSLTG